MIRWTCNVRLKDHISSDSLLRKLGINNIQTLLQYNRLRWFGHVVRNVGCINSITEFFEHEQHKYPVEPSEYGQLRATTSKADVLTCLSVIQEPQYEKPAVDACVVDGPVIVNQIPPKPSQT